MQSELLARDHPYFRQLQQHPLVMAHRGGAALWPENTLFAFDKAVDLGIHVLETEIHSSKEGALVLIHDRTVDRTTNGTGPINAFTLKELKELDAGYNWSSDGGQTFPFRGQGITIPTLEEVFTAFPKILFNIDIKQVEPSLVLPLCEMIRGFNMVEKVMVASFNSQTIKQFRLKCPEVATSASRSEISIFFAMNLLSLGSAYRTAAQALQVPEYSMGLHLLTQKFVDTAHKLNLKVHAWTINELADMRRLLELGVDGIITDYPDRLISLLSSNP